MNLIGGLVSGAYGQTLLDDSGIKPEPTAITQVGTPTSSPEPGDVDGDGVPDLAFVAPDGAAEVVVGISSRLRKLRVDTGVLRADVGKIGGKWGVVTVKRALARFRWNFIDLLGAPATRLFADVKGDGQPVMGCYEGDTYSAAEYRTTNTAVRLTRYFSGGQVATSLPRSIQALQCSAHPTASDLLFYLRQSSRDKRFTALAIQEGASLISSSKLSALLTNVSLVVVPRGADKLPTAAIVAKLRGSTVIRVLDSRGTWRSITVPRIPRRSSIRAGAGVRVGDRSFIVLQLFTRSGTSYVRVSVDDRFL